MIFTTKYTSLCLRAVRRVHTSCVHRYTQATCIYANHMYICRPHVYMQATCIYAGHMYICRPHVYAGHMYICKPHVYVQASCIYAGHMHICRPHVYMQATRIPIQDMQATRIQIHTKTRKEETNCQVIRLFTTKTSVHELKCLRILPLMPCGEKLYKYTSLRKSTPDAGENKNMHACMFADYMWYSVQLWLTSKLQLADFWSSERQFLVSDSRQSPLKTFS